AVDLAMVVKAGQSVADAEALELPVLLLELVLEPLDAEHRADARLELRKVDRLGQVVVSAGIEPHDLVLGRVARGHEDDRDERQVVVVLDLDRKSTRLNSSHVKISYAVFCLKKKKKHYHSFIWHARI